MAKRNYQYEKRQKELAKKKKKEDKRLRKLEKKESGGLGSEDLLAEEELRDLHEDDSGDLPENSDEDLKS